jgi:putative addiction module component (TIGR02574 family)
MTSQQLLAEAALLPADERVALVDSLLRSLHVPEPEIDRQWGAVALKRLAEIRSGAVQPLPGEQVLARLRSRLQQ